MVTELSHCAGWLRNLLTRCPCARKGLVEADADTGWKRQNNAARKNVAYQLVSPTHNGQLQRIYRNDGAEALREHIKMVLPKYLYFNGRKAGIITKLEFARYRHRLSKKAETEACEICNCDSKREHMTVCDECGCTFHIFCLNPLLAKVPDDLWFCDSCKEDLEHLKHTDSTLEYMMEEDDDVADVKHHPACWNLKMRGVVGETPLHICFLSSTEDDLAIAKVMLEEFPYLAHDIYEGTTFFGENALHFAIVRQNMESVKLLVQYGVSLVARARGTFFLPTDLKEGTCKKEKTRFMGTAYYGEYPLAFAASLGLDQMYDYFIRQSELNPSLGKVNPNAQDTFGNTVLHLCVIHKQKSMYIDACKHRSFPADQNIKNKMGMTPLQLACRLGHSDMFDVILDLSSRPFWTYGKITCLACPLDILDSVNSDGKKNEGSALNLIIKGTTAGHFKMLESDVVARLLDEKWKRYVRSRFVFKFCWALLHLTLLYIATQLRPANRDNLLGPTDTKSIVRYIMELGMLIGCTATFIVEFKELRLLKPKRYFQNLIQTPARLVFIIGCFLLYICAIFRLTGRYTLEDMTLMIAIPCSWTYIFFFYRGTESLGPYVVMIGKMLSGDILRFWIIMSVVLCVFATVFYYLFLEGDLSIEEEKNEGFSKPWRAFISMFQMTFGNFDYTEFYKSRVNWLAASLFIIFMLLSPILLLNMLIAMMARTYEDVKERARVEWRRQWTRIILIMEGAVGKDTLLYHQSKYSVNIPLAHWVDQTKTAASCHRKRLRQDAELHINPVYELDEDITGSRETLITNNSVSKKAWSNHDEIKEEPPITIKALLIMKSMERCQNKTKKRAKYNWNVVREIINEKEGKDLLGTQGSSDHRKDQSVAFRAMTSVLRK
ncbi:transient receptor potential cation channel subfamily V member 5-like [Amphiura filiformis]|uniref:transient receptor potential cation channel subfamily V member 5-like n=1 Tax=Amphiura filiformis TaxID=82378 RepID=UPI003B2196CF